MGLNLSDRSYKNEQRIKQMEMLRNFLEPKGNGLVTKFKKLIYQIILGDERIMTGKKALEYVSDNDWKRIFGKHISFVKSALREDRVLNNTSAIFSEGGVFSKKVFLEGGFGGYVDHKKQRERRELLINNNHGKEFAMTAYLHELVHQYVWDEIALGEVKRLDLKKHYAWEELERIYILLKNNINHGLIKKIKKKFIDSNKNLDIYINNFDGNLLYAFSDIQEFIAVLYSDPMLMEYIKNIGEPGCKVINRISSCMNIIMGTKIFNEFIYNY